MSDRVSEAFERRLFIYRKKQEQADPMAEDCYNRFDAIGYVIEAIELLATEAGISLNPLETKG